MIDHIDSKRLSGECHLADITRNPDIVVYGTLVPPAVWHDAVGDVVVDSISGVEKMFEPREILRSESEGEAAACFLEFQVGNPGKAYVMHALTHLTFNPDTITRGVDTGVRDHVINLTRLNEILSTNIKAHARLGEVCIF